MFLVYRFIGYMLCVVFFFYLLYKYWYLKKYFIGLDVVYIISRSCLNSVR